MDLKQILSVSACSTDIKTRTKEDALAELGNLLATSPGAAGISGETIKEALLEREILGSTGFGNGIAIPHCKIEGIPDFMMALAISPRGTQFDAMDNHSVHIFCAIIGPPDEPEKHLRLLAVASRILGSGRSRYELLNSATPYALREGFLFHAAPATALMKKKGKTKLLMTIVQDEDTYEEIMELFLEMDILGAVTHEGSLMGQVLSGAPIFADFLEVLGRSDPEPKTIITTVPEESLDEIVSAIEEITGDLDNHLGACIIVLTPDLIRGSLETIR